MDTWAVAQAWRRWAGRARRTSTSGWSRCCIAGRTEGKVAHLIWRYKSSDDFAKLRPLNPPGL